MLAALFSFRGRVGRLAYLGWSIAALVLIMAVGATYLLIGAILSTFLSASEPGPAILGVAMAAAMSVIAFWSGLARGARRVRDAGYDPLVVIGVLMAISVFDGMVLARLTEICFFWPLDGQTPLGGLATIGYFLFVLLWPSSLNRPCHIPTAAIREPLVP